MIIAAGLSPAWQQVLVFDRFQPGAVDRAAEAHWCGSGKVLNVGLALHHLSGGEADTTLTISTLGGLAFEAIDREFQTLGVPRRWVRTASPTRVCTTIVDRSTKSATELVENAQPITAAELSEFRQAFAQAASAAQAVVLTGSLPPEAPSTIFRELLQHVDCPVVLDIRGTELLVALEARPTLVKPNREELGHTLGRPLGSDSDVESAMAELQRRGAQAVLVTSGNGKVLLAANGRMVAFDPDKVDEVVNPIGCGDCLAAGAAWALGHGADIETAVRQGLALAAENMRTLLPSDFDGRRLKLQHR